MALATDRIAVMTENLKDAGLDGNEVTECLEMLDNQNFSALQKFLSDYRTRLLNGIHEYNNRIECLDYFTYILKKSLEVK
ncbi:MAG: hypothetical protein K2K02_00805 [Ruminococcus sp.]|nr:hypothetical protein [Ruminococcus sp.]